MFKYHGIIPKKANYSEGILFSLNFLIINLSQNKTQWKDIIPIL